LKAALAAPEPFGTYLGLGITSLIAFQAVVNMSVAMGLVPTKGLTLPFISYGGSSLIVLMGAAGLLLSISSASESGGGKRARLAQKPAKSGTPDVRGGVPA
jgi:cell division protein FtsW